MTTSELIGTSASIISLAFGFWQFLVLRKTKRLLALEAIEIHKNISIALGAAQQANRDVVAGDSPIFQIGRCEGLCQSTLHESAKLFCNLEETTIADIDEMINNGQLQPTYRSMYHAFSDRKARWVRSFLRRLF